jgi:hypothetical protein
MCYDVVGDNSDISKTDTPDKCICELSNSPQVNVSFIPRGASESTTRVHSTLFVYENTLFWPYIVFYFTVKNRKAYN